MSQTLGREVKIMQSLKFAVIGLVSALMISAPASAQSLSQDDAKGFTEALVVELRTIAKDGALSDTSRDRAYRDALQRRLVTDQIGAFLFKSIPDGSATDAQLREYNQLFPSYISAAFASKIGDLAERQINVTESRARGEKEVIVRSELLDDAGFKKASIDWRIREVNGQPRLLDVLVQGVSPLVTKRQEFASLAKRKGVDALLDYMKKIAN